MEPVAAYEIISQTLTATLLSSAPVLAVALIVGLMIAFFQALTQIQEMTLTFVPKVTAIVIVFWMTMGFMTQSLVAFFEGHIVPLIARGL